eukprot:COSAG01_NODE_52634_length_345_cov_0.833333_1_plen_50_part_01
MSRPLRHGYRAENGAFPAPRLLGEGLVDHAEGEGSGSASGGGGAALRAAA